MDQQTPPEWTVDYWACVTPASRAPVREQHEPVLFQVDEAIEHPDFRYVSTPQGKLSSRNYAHDLAADQHDVIVAGDADAPPIGEDALIALLDPFASTQTVATNGTPVAPWTPIGAATNLAGWTEDLVRPHLNGQAHAISSSAWRAAGPFDTSIDETNPHRVRREEEFRFRRRLAEHGDVVDVLEARFRNDTRRVECRLERSFGREGSPYCRRIGTETFQPNRR